MLGFITVLLCCQLAGELLVVAAGLPLPGPVVGMVILFAGLAVRGEVPDDLGMVADGLLRHLSLLFVPAGVGVVLHVALIRQEWVAISAGLVASTAVTIAVTGGLMAWLGRIGTPRASTP
jgi:holin-like protein